MAGNPDAYIGRRFWADYTVVTVDAGVVWLRRAGEADLYRISLEEFEALIAAELLVERRPES